MTARRYASTRPTSALTGGDDQPETPCARDVADRMTRGLETGAYEPSAFDVLIDLTAGPVYQAALRDARALCGGCPVSATCLRDNRDEPWALAVITGKTVMQRTAAKRESVGKWAERRAARIADLREFAALGIGVDEAAERLGLDRKSLNKWCVSNKLRDLYAALNPEPARGNQYRQQTEVGEITTRRKKAAA